MDKDSLGSWLALQLSPGIGPYAAKPLLLQYKSIGSIFDASRAELADACGGRIPDLASLNAQAVQEAIQKTQLWLRSGPDRYIVTYHDPDYPALLREIVDPPVLLYVVGDRNCLRYRQLAIVGSRNPTPAGRGTSHALACALANAGLTVTSGLALGVDAAAHHGALDASGRTVAVCGTGIDQIYPACHDQLAASICQHGLLLSEFPLGMPPLKQNFPKRNRVISGLSMGVLVVEAAVRSGSLITARMALEQGRDVFAVPGSIHSPQSRGCHKLIQQGAKLVETTSDVLQELGFLAQLVDQKPLGKPEIPVTATKVEKKLLDCMAYEAVSIDDLVRISGLTAEVISSMLLQMELSGWVEPLSGGRYARTTNY